MRLSNASSINLPLLALAIICSLFTSVRANAAMQGQAVAASCPAENRLTADVPAGSEVVPVLCTTDIRPDTQVRIGGGTDEMEVVTVLAVAKDSFRARIRRAHKEGSTVEILTSLPRGSTETGSDKNEGGTNKPGDRGVESKPCKVEIHYKSDRGKITVGCPKVWRSDRVFTVLDGILRDVDSITVKALQDLDPNAVNAAELIRLVTDFQAAVKFDQAAAINSGLERQKIGAERSRDLENFNADKANNELIQKHKAELLKEKFDLENKERDLASKGQTDQNQDPLKTLKAQQTVVNDQLAKLSPAPPPSSNPGGTTGTTGSGSTDGQTGGSGVAGPTNGTIPTQTLSAASSTSAAAGTASTTPSTAIPDSLKAVLQQALQNPSLPASMRLDNVIELLHQRLAREFSVLYDDLSRQTQTYNVYLVQFDIGVVPFHGAKNRDARVELEFVKDGVQAYELYPGTSSYNILRGLDKTSRIGLSGMAQTVLGLGISANFAREKNQLRSGLSQSLFVSGFGAGRSKFGWQIGSSPFDNLITPGSRIVNAILLVPKSEAKPGENLHFTARYCWPKRENRYDFRGAALKAALAPTHLMGFPALDFGPVDEESCAQKNELDEITMVLPEEPQLTIKRISYNPTTLKETPGTQASAAATDKPNTVQITFNEPVDPNLTITVADKLINRVRDVRGRALFGATQEDLAGTANERKLLTDSRFGILEKDTLGPDTWVQLNSKAILLSISKETAGTDTFPTITLSDPGWGGEELIGLASRQAGDHHNGPDIRIGEWFFQNTLVPVSAFLPLFTQAYQPGRIHAYVDQLNSTKDLPQRIRIISETKREGRSSPVWLHEQAQVILVAKTNAEPNKGHSDHWALECDEDEGTLSCKIPATVIAESYCQISSLDRFKVWVDEPPYLERPGLWSDTDLVRDGDAWKEEPYAKGEWTDVRELPCKLCPPPSGAAATKAGKAGKHRSATIWDRWTATIQLRNLTLSNPHTSPPTAGKDYCIEELEEINSTLAEFQQKLSNAIRLFSGKNRLDESDSATLGLLNKWSEKIQEARQPSEPLLAVQDFAQNKGHACSKSPLRLTVDKNSHSLTLEIPFSVLPALPEHLHLLGGTCPGPACDRITLPNLVSRLLPGAVRLTSNDNGHYHIEGEHLKAVDEIRLESPGQTIPISDIAIGFNSVDFFLDPKKLTDKATYSVFAVISGLTVPLYQENAKKQLEQVSFTYEEPKDDKKSTTKQGSENGDSKAGKENNSVKLKMDIAFKTDAEANTSKTAKPGTKPVGTSQAGKKNTGAAGATGNAQQTNTTAYNAGAQKK
jgi:hypothetical protein